MFQRKLIVPPGSPSPALCLPLATPNQAAFDLALANPDFATLLSFYLGGHSEDCLVHLRALENLYDDFVALGVEPVAVSGDDRENARKTVIDLGLEHLPVAYGLETSSMLDWGLFLSRGITDDEPETFCEPAIFLVKPGSILYSAAIFSTPFARSRPEDLLDMVRFVREHDYPARGAG